MRSLALSIVGLIISGSASLAAGFQTATVPDPGNPPLEVGIWYPSTDPAAPHPLETYRQTVASDGALSGDRLPLVVISHGTGGSYAGHYDTAIALADAGFVVVAMTHTGDNYRDQSTVGTAQDFIGRVRHVSRTLDWMLANWSSHDRLDASRIGMFGYSAGGITALLTIGGDVDMTQGVPHCRAVPADPMCRYIPKAAFDAPPRSSPPIVWQHDPRVRAAVIAAPAMGFAFSPQSLGGIAIPVQLWRGSADEVLLHPWHAEAVHRALPAGHEYRVVPNAGHYAFLTMCSDVLRRNVPEICADPPGFDRAAFHEQFNKAVVTFFSEKLATD